VDDATMLGNSTLIALVVALIAGLAASFVLGLWRGGRNETSAGLDALCGMKWREYSHLIEDLLRERGFARSGDDRRPGEGGFDLLMTRGTSRYLVECKNGAAHRVTEQAVRDLAALVDMQGAEGAVLATTGHVDPAAYATAANRRVELIAGPNLWRQVKPWVPHDLKLEVEARARGGTAKGAAISAACALVAGLLVAAFWPTPGAEPATAAAPILVPDAATVAPAAAPAPAVAAPPAAATPRAPIALPDPNLSDTELASRRAMAAMEARSNPALLNTVWSTKSTMVATLRQPGAEITDALFEHICGVLVQFEELRYTRLQIESPAVDPNAPPTVRFKQCR
jgi:restriction system protein